MQKYILTFLMIMNLLFLGSINQTMAGGVSMSPSFFDLSANPSDQILLEIELKNNENSVFKLTPNFFNAEINDDNNEISIVEESDKEPANWISLNQEMSEIVLEIGETKRIPFKVDIPSYADSKAYYPIIVIELTPINTNAQVGSNYRLGNILYLNIGGDKNKAVSIEEFVFDKSIYFSPNIKINTVISNSGTTHIRPRGLIEFYDPSGVRQSEQNNINENLDYILPKQKITNESKFIDNTIENKFFPPIGNYKAVLNIFETNPQVPISSQEKEFLVIPWVYLIYSALVLIVITAIITKVVKTKNNKTKFTK